MDYRDYVNGIAFSFLPPHVDARLFTQTLDDNAQRSVAKEVENTLLPLDNGLMRTRLEPLLYVPRMSTFAVAAMINRGVSGLSSDKCFVNVGVWHGFSLFAGMMGNPNTRCIGVDNFTCFDRPRAQFWERFRRYKGPSHDFYDMDYREYFRSLHKGQIGFYFYDGDHHYSHQLNGLRMAEPFFSDDCIVAIDDTNWMEPRAAVNNFIAHSRYRYDIILDETTCHDRHPTLWNGIIILQRASLLSRTFQKRFTWLAGRGRFRPRRFIVSS